MKKQIIDLTDAVISQHDFTTATCSLAKELTIEDLSKMHEMLNKDLLSKSIFETSLRINHQMSYGIKPPRGFLGIIHFS